MHRARSRVDPIVVALAVVIALAAVLRFSTLDTQSFWYDESLSVGLARLPFGATALGVNDQAEPPLYFLLAWLWARVFGYGEVGMRSLPALFGVLTVPAAYAAGAELVNRRVGLAAAALAATSPALIAYSQEARSYSLFILLSVASIAFLARALDAPRARPLAGWAVCCALALTAHYFAFFLVVGETAALLVWARARQTWIAVGGVIVAGLALLPLALHQRANGVDWIKNSPLRGRLHEAGSFFLVGPSSGTKAAFLVAVAWAGALALVAWRGDGRARRALLVTLGLGAVVLGLPLLGAAAGSDYVLDRNLLGGWILFALVLAIPLGLGGRARAGAVLAAAACAVFVWADVRVVHHRELQRDDWRGVARALGPPRPGRVVVVVPGWQEKPLALYDRGLRVMGLPRVANEVIDVTYNGARPRPGPRGTAPPPRPFRRVWTNNVQRMTLTLYRAPRPSLVPLPPPPQAPWSDGPVAYVEGALL